MQVASGGVIKRAPDQCRANKRAAGGINKESSEHVGNLLNCCTVAVVLGHILTSPLIAIDQLDLDLATSRLRLVRDHLCV